MQIQPYLFFEGRADEAFAFYQRVLGAEVTMLMRYRESPEPPQEQCQGSAYSPDKVMHANVRIGDSTVMASDGLCSGKPSFTGFALSLPLRDEREARRVFTAFAEGGEVRMPLGKTFWSPCFGMVVDRFGVLWMVTVDEA
jgi:PhnB protein